MQQYENIESKSELVDEYLQERLCEVFERLDREVVIKGIMDSSKDRCIEAIRFYKAIAKTSDYIKLELYEIGENPEIELDVECESILPTIGLYNNSGYSGIGYAGIPGGKEINSFIIAILNLGSIGQEIDDDTVARINSIESDVNLDVFVSLSCHHCADVVRACQRISAINHRIKSKMIDQLLCLDIARKYDIKRVPTLIINHSEMVIGSKSLYDILDMLGV